MKELIKKLKESIKKIAVRVDGSLPEEISRGGSQEKVHDEIQQEVLGGTPERFPGRIQERVFGEISAGTDRGMLNCFGEGIPKRSPEETQAEIKFEKNKPGGGIPNATPGVISEENPGKIS